MSTFLPAGRAAFTWSNCSSEFAQKFLKQVKNQNVKVKKIAIAFKKLNHSEIIWPDTKRVPFVNNTFELSAASIVNHLPKTVREYDHYHIFVKEVKQILTERVQARILSSFKL